MDGDGTADHLDLVVTFRSWRRDHGWSVGVHRGDGRGGFGPGDRGGQRDPRLQPRLAWPPVTAR